MSDEDNVLDTGEAEVIADENHEAVQAPEEAPESDDVKAVREHYEKELAKRDAKFQKRIDKETSTKRQMLERMERIEARVLGDSGSKQDEKEVSRDDFQNDNEYVKAISKGVTKSEIREMIAAEKAQADAKEFDSKCEKVLADAAKIGEFDPDDFKPLPPASVYAILDSDHPAKIIAHLHLNPDEYERIAELSPTKQVREITKLEALLESKAVKSKAPAPIAPLGGKNSGGITYREDMSPEDYKKWTEQEHKKRR